MIDGEEGSLCGEGLKGFKFASLKTSHFADWPEAINGDQEPDPPLKENRSAATISREGESARRATTGETSLRKSSAIPEVQPCIIHPSPSLTIRCHVSEEEPRDLLQLLELRAPPNAPS